MSFLKSIFKKSPNVVEPSEKFKMLRKVLFVCYGNICRSPMAEAIFNKLIEKQKLTNMWKADSAATSDRAVGRPADIRTRETLQKYGINYIGKARQITEDDYYAFDFILGMDQDNFVYLKANAPNDRKAVIRLLGDYDPLKERIIRDPFFDHDMKGFEKCYEQCLRSCDAFLCEFSPKK